MPFRFCIRIYAFSELLGRFYTCSSFFLEISTSKLKQKQEWELHYIELKKQSNVTARDFLLTQVGNDEFPQAIKLPEVLLEVLIDEAFTLTDPLSI
jgi:hypothetical protein